MSRDTASSPLRTASNAACSALRWPGSASDASSMPRNASMPRSSMRVAAGLMSSTRPAGSVRSNPTPARSAMSCQRGEAGVASVNCDVASWVMSA